MKLQNLVTQSVTLFVSVDKATGRRSRPCCKAQCKSGEYNTSASTEQSQVSVTAEQQTTQHDEIPNQSYDKCKVPNPTKEKSNRQC